MNFASMERSCTIGGHRSDRCFNMYTFGGAHAPITLRTTGACQTNKNCKKRKLLVCSRELTEQREYRCNCFMVMRTDIVDPSFCMCRQLARHQKQRNLL